jgi:hypothetical protein
MKTRRTAISRIELLVVIVIIVLVPSILMASLEAARELAKIPVCANQLRQIGLAIPIYAELYDGRMPWWGYWDPEEEVEETHPYIAYRGDRPEWRFPTGKLKPMRLACFYEAGLITEPKIFYCPANKDGLYKYESYIKYKGKTTKWGYLPQDYNILDPGGNVHNQWTRIGYVYYPTDSNGETIPSYWDPDIEIPIYTAKKLSNLDSRIPYLTDIIGYRDSISHNIQDNPGVNALFKDGHVVYCDDRDVFDNPAWDQFNPPPRIEWREFYYRVFKLIGQSCGPTE